jgi:Plasmid maintenance system antidote protein
MTKKGLPPIHPGVLLREMLEELGVTQAGFARAFDQSPQHWLNLQAAYDLKTCVSYLTTASLTLTLSPRVRGFDS